VDLVIKSAQSADHFIVKEYQGVYMKKNVIIMLAALVAAGAAFGQEAPGQGVPRLGILPFTGGLGRDGDTIATLFANSRELG
jgi:hypothetical protein